MPAEVLKKAKVLVLNYPNNPTGASATPEFFAQGGRVCARQNRLVVIHDAAYAALVFEGRPLSFLATPGAKEVGVELHSASKSFNMTGWRCGFVAGNELLVKAYGDVKDNTRLGPVPGDPTRGGATASTIRRSRQKIAAKYSRRMDALVRVLAKAGFKARKPKGSFFLYVKAPKAAVKADGAAHRVPERRGRFAVAHHREADFDRAVGRCGGLSAVQCDVRRQRRGGRGAHPGEIARRLGDVRFEF